MHWYVTTNVKLIVCSLVPRLPRSGTRTLKLCRRGEPGIFCHVKSGKDRKEVLGGKDLIVRGRTRDLNRKKSEGSEQLTIRI